MKIGGRRLLAGEHVARIWQRSPAILVSGGLLFVLAATAAATIYEYRNNKSYRIALTAMMAGRGVRGALDSIASAPPRYLDALLSAGELDTLQIDIKFRNWQKILRKRRDAIESGILLVEADDDVKAKVFLDGRNIPIKMRLKGDWLDHLDSDRGWSFRVRVRDGDQIYGMRRFSIQHPRSRAYYTEPLFLAHVRSEGILAPRYTFARVVLNGKDWGVMAVEEHFNKELLESQGRKENILGRIDESLYWEQKAKPGDHQYTNNYETNPFKPFSRSKLERDPRLKAQASVADGLFAALQAGRVAPSEVFDVDLLARFIVLCEAWDGWHALRWHNVRFYLNPYTLLFEPVAYDHGEEVGFHAESLAAASLDGELVTALLLDPVIREALVREAGRLADRVDQGVLEELLRDVIAEARGAIALENPLIAPPDLGIVERNIAAMRAAGADYFRLTDERGAERVPEDPSVYATSLGDVTPRLYESGLLEIVNRLPIPVQLEALRFVPTPPPPAEGGEAATPPPPQLATVALSLPPTLDVRHPSTVEYQVPAGFAPENGTLEVLTRHAGRQDPRSTPIEREIPYYDRHPLQPRSGAEELAARSAWLQWDAAAGTLRVRPGEWRVEGPLVVPKGVPLVIPAGVVLRFGPDAFLRVAGPLHVQGTADRPVALRSAGAETTWGGILVDSAGAPSTWEHVSIEDTRALEADGLILTGAVTFRKSPVEMRDVVFDRTVAEDALNLVRSDFLLDRVRIANTRSDAFDCDFCEGRITATSFIEVGGDAFDVSGANVEIDQSTFDRIRDKAVSAGERSRVAARNLTIRRSGSGVVSKDASRVEVSGATIDGIEVAALMAYTKKPEFGPAEMEARDISVRNTATRAIAQRGSRIELDGAVVEPIEIDIEQLYETGPMKK